MPGDWTLGLDWPTCGIDHQKCHSYLSRCDCCDDKERRSSMNRWAIVTNSFEKAKSILQTIVVMCDKGTVIRTVYNKNEVFAELSDGTLIRWWRCSASSRGMKCCKLWCDREIDQSVFENAIEPNYYGEKENIIWIQGVIWMKKCWSLKDVPENKKKDFIIDCLTGYINEVEKMKEDGITKIHYPEIIDTAELYKEIIRMLQAGGE